MKSVNSFVVVAVLTSLVSAGCNGQSSPTSPSQVTTTPPVTPVPSGPVQIAKMEGFDMNPFVPNQNNPGPGTKFTRTSDDLDVRIDLGTPGDYSFMVIVLSGQTGDADHPVVNLSFTPFTFSGTSGSVKVSYDSSKCFKGECFLYISNRSFVPIVRNDKNLARVYGTPEL